MEIFKEYDQYDGLGLAELIEKKNRFRFQRSVTRQWNGSTG